MVANNGFRTAEMTLLIFMVKILVGLAVNRDRTAAFSLSSKTSANVRQFHQRRVLRRALATSVDTPDFQFP